MTIFTDDYRITNLYGSGHAYREELFIGTWQECVEYVKKSPYLAFHRNVTPDEVALVQLKRIENDCGEGMPCAGGLIERIAIPYSDYTIEQKKATLEQAGWKIFVASDDNRDQSWSFGIAITPDDFRAETRTYTHDAYPDTDDMTEEEEDEIWNKYHKKEAETSQKILEEIVNKAWNHYRKD